MYIFSALPNGKQGEQSHKVYIHCGARLSQCLREWFKRCSFRLDLFLSFSLFLSFALYFSLFQAIRHSDLHVVCQFTRCNNTSSVRRRFVALCKRIIKQADNSRGKNNVSHCSSTIWNQEREGITLAMSSLLTSTRLVRGVDQSMGFTAACRDATE